MSFVLFAAGLGIAGSGFSRWWLINAATAGVAYHITSFVAALYMGAPWIIWGRPAEFIDFVFQIVIAAHLYAAPAAVGYFLGILANIHRPPALSAP